MKGLIFNGEFDERRIFVSQPIDERGFSFERCLKFVLAQDKIKIEFKEASKINF